MLLNVCVIGMDRIHVGEKKYKYVYVMYMHVCMYDTVKSQQYKQINKQ